MLHSIISSSLSLYKNDSSRCHNLKHYLIHFQACIIGLRTGKVLYIGVRNAYCCVCAKWEAKAEKPKHLCFKNWNGPATSMEADIIAEGFKTSVQLHGIKYGKIIGMFKL